jgi:hypothetical protein
MTRAALVAPRVFALIRPATYSLALKLFVLTDGRAGSAKFKPNVATFYETSLVTSLYEHLLMDPELAHLEIRHEMPFRSKTPAVGASERVDLWIRPPKGGLPHLYEAGDYNAGKVNSDLGKIKRLNPKGTNYFIAYFRGKKKLKDHPYDQLLKSLARVNGLDAGLCFVEKKYCEVFEVYRPNGDHDQFGVALIKAK